VTSGPTDWVADVARDSGGALCEGLAPIRAFDSRENLHIIQWMLNYPSNVDPKTQHLAEDDRLARCLKALGHPVRLAIFSMLMEGIQCNCEIAERLGLSLSLISHHMRVLCEVGLVGSERDRVDARWIYYCADKEALVHLAGQMERLLDVRRIKPRRPSCGPRGCDPAKQSSKDVKTKSVRGRTSG